MSNAAPDADRIHTYRTYGQTLIPEAPATQLTEPPEETYLSIAEPTTTAPDSLILYGGRQRTISKYWYLVFDAEALHALRNGFPEPTSVYGEGQIHSVMPENSYATQFTGSTPLLYTPYPNKSISSPGLKIELGQPEESGSYYLLTPSQTTDFIKLLTAVNKCHKVHSRFESTIANSKIIESDGSMSDRTLLGDYFE